MARTQFKAIGPIPLLASQQNAWPSEFKGFKQLHYASRTSTRRSLRLLQRTSDSKVTTSTSQRIRPVSAARSFRMINQSAAAPNWAVSICDHLEKMLFTSERNDDKYESGSPSETRTNYFWSNNFEPVPEMAPTTDLHVTGTIPECMNGEFMRVGPNPKYMPLGEYHWFDGDGMIHGLQIKDGKATYVARYVQTSRLQQEECYGAPKFLKVGDLKGMKGFYCLALEVLRRTLGVLHASSFYAGNANTALVYHNKKLLALQDGDRPYIIKVLKDGDLQTVGIEDFNQKLQHTFAAHSKIDPITGEMFVIAYQPALLTFPRLLYRIVSKEGILGEPVLITTPHFSFMHDFAITENYAIFMDLPLGLDLLGMAKGEFALKFDASKESRLGVLPRYATNDSKIRWFTIPTCYILHTVNAWEEGDEAVLTCCRMDDIDMGYLDTFLESLLAPTLYEFRLNLRTGEVKHRQLSNLLVEFPRINSEYTGRKVRYAYCCTLGDEKRDQFTGVAKFDLTMKPPSSSEISAKYDVKTGGNLAGVFNHGSGRCGGDTVFVPRNLGTAMAAEDDGYLITFVHDESTGKSEAIIIDAKTMGPEPVAVIELPRRVPHGFHAHFVTEVCNQFYQISLGLAIVFMLPMDRGFSYPVWNQNMTLQNLFLFVQAQLQQQA